MKKCCRCGYNQITGTEEFCPQCNVNLTYKCKKCGKELINGKKSKCPLCIGKTKRLIGIIFTCFSALSVVPSALLSMFLAFAIPGPVDDVVIIVSVVLLYCSLFITGLVLLIWGIIIVVKLSEKKEK